jgi:hypothetical protein
MATVTATATAGMRAATRTSELRARGPARQVQRSQVLKMAFVKCQAYLAFFGFFDSPP